jgi:uncharacterized protein (DUF952 family)
VQAGCPYIPTASGGPSGLDGFIHCSTAAQVAGTATGWFAGRDDLVLVALDPAVLGDALVYEPGALGEADPFPHLYAPIDPTRVAAAPYRGPT